MDGKKKKKRSVHDDSLFKETPRTFTEDVEYVFPSSKEEPLKNEPEEKIGKISEEETEEKIREKNINHHKKAGAPSNLPIAEEDMATLFKEMEKSVPEPKEKTEGKPIGKNVVHREPTEDEIRERLNKLLGGGMLK